MASPAVILRNNLQYPWNPCAAHPGQPCHIFAFLTSWSSFLTGLSCVGVRFQEGSIRTPLDASDYNLVLNSMNKRLEAHKADLARKFSFANAKLASAQRSGNQKRMMQFQNQIERLQELGSTYNEHTELWNRHHHEFRESREFKELYKVKSSNPP